MPRQVQSRPGGRRATVAIVAAPDVLEDWLDPLGVSFERFVEELSGGWMFNYVDALSRRGIHSVVVCHSENATMPHRMLHRPTGATVWALPPGSRLEELRAIQRSPPPPPTANRDPVTIASKVRRHSAQFVTPLRPLFRALRAEHCDAILSQDYENPRFDSCVLVGQLLRVPVFASFQGLKAHKSWFEHWLRPLTLRGCAGLIIADDTEIERVRRVYGVPEDKLANIPNPLDTGVWRASDRAEARKRLGIPSDARVAVSHGRIHIVDKGIDVLLDAWKSVVAERPHVDLRLLLVGSGDDSALVERMIEAERPRGVELIDMMVDLDRLRLYLSAADVFVFAGRYMEGFPVAPTEAMALRLPVVATASAGITNLFHDAEQNGGIVVPIDERPAIAAALGRLLDDRELALEYGRRARRRVEEYCSMEAIARRLEDFMTGRGMDALHE